MAKKTVERQEIAWAATLLDRRRIELGAVLHQFFVNL